MSEAAVAIKSLLICAMPILFVACAEARPKRSQLGSPTAASKDAPGSSLAARAGRFHSKDHGFSVRFPGEPVHSSKEMTSPAGTVAMEVFRSTAKQKGDTAFGIIVVIPPTPLIQQFVTLDFAQVMVREQTQPLVTGAGGRIVREGKVRFGDVEAFESIVEVAGSRGRYVAFPCGDRAYQVFAMGRSERAGEIDVFVESFTVDSPGKR